MPKKAEVEELDLELDEDDEDEEEEEDDEEEEEDDEEEDDDEEEEEEEEKPKAKAKGKKVEEKPAAKRGPGRPPGKKNAKVEEKPAAKRGPGRPPGKTSGKKGKAGRPPGKKGEKKLIIVGITENEEGNSVFTAIDDEKYRTTKDAREALQEADPTGNHFGLVKVIAEYHVKRGKPKLERG